ncbi:MAG: hypothetical protein SGBAC_003302 [Bacillariaceae sp.]
MGSSTGNPGDEDEVEVSEQAREHRHHRPFPITEIRTSQLMAMPPRERNMEFLKFLSYGVPWAAWLINVALLITPRYQTADISLCIEGDIYYLQEEQLMATGITSTNSTTTTTTTTTATATATSSNTLSYLCEYRFYCLGVTRSTEELMSGASGAGVPITMMSAEEAVNDLAGEDLYHNLALGASIVPVALGFILMCLCCGPVLLGEFAKGQSTLWNISFLVYFISGLFSGLTMLFLKTDICHEDQICTVLQENDRYSTVASSILGFNGAIVAALNDAEAGDTTMEVDCHQTCSVDAGFYLSIVTAVLWWSALVGTCRLKKANAKIHP